MPGGVSHQQVPKTRELASKQVSWYLGSRRNSCEVGVLGVAPLPALAQLPRHGEVTAQGGLWGADKKNAELKPAMASSRFPSPAAASPPQSRLER